MDEKIYELALSINKELANNAAIKKLNELDKIISSNEEIMSLSYKMDLKCTNYNDCLKLFSENSPEAKNALKELNLAKYELDNHPLVKEYNQTYSEVSKLLYEMNNILFSQFKKEEGC